MNYKVQLRLIYVVLILFVSVFLYYATRLTSGYVNFVESFYSVNVNASQWQGILYNMAYGDYGTAKSNFIELYKQDQLDVAYIFDNVNDFTLRQDYIDSYIRFTSVYDERLDATYALIIDGTIESREEPFLLYNEMLDESENSRLTTNFLLNVTVDILEESEQYTLPYTISFYSIVLICIYLLYKGNAINNSLERQYDKLKTILDSLNNVVLIIDPNYVIDIASYYALAVFGKEPQTLVGKSIYDIIPEFNLESNGVTIVDTDGSNTILELKVKELDFDDAGKYLIVAFDKTREILDTRKLLFANEQFRAMAYTVRHDLANDIDSVYFGMDLLRMEELPDKQEIKDGLFLINEGAKALISKINALHKWTDIIAKKIDFDVIDLESVVADVMVRYPNSIEVEGELPRIRGDFGTLSILVENVVKNALTHAKSNVLIKAVDNGFIIKDFGKGFPLEMYERLKLPGGRFNSTGSGLGLTIISAIAGLHNLKMRVYNDNGAVFEFKNE